MCRWAFVLQLLLGDFTHHNIDLCAILVETCGRFLYKLPHTKARMEGVLEQMMRLRRSKNLDLRLSMMVEAAFYSVKVRPVTSASDVLQ